MINQLVMSARSPLSGASIFHTYPLSQPCPVSFISSSTSHGVFRGCHKNAVVPNCLSYMQAARKYFNNGEKRGKFTIFFLDCYANVSECSVEIKEPTHISVLKIKRDRVDSRVQLLWRLRVIGSSVC